MKIPVSPSPQNSSDVMIAATSHSHLSVSPDRFLKHTGLLVDGDGGVKGDHCQAETPGHSRQQYSQSLTHTHCATLTTWSQSSVSSTHSL